MQLNVRLKFQVYIPSQTPFPAVCPPTLLQLLVPALCEHVSLAVGCSLSSPAMPTVQESISVEPGHWGMVENGMRQVKCVEQGLHNVATS